MSDTGLPTPLGPLSAEELRRHVESFLAPVPAEHTSVQIEYRVGGTLRIEAAHRVNDHWRIEGSLAWNLRTGRVDEGSVKVVASWV